MIPPAAGGTAAPQGPKKYNPATLLGKTFKIPGLTGSVSFKVIDLAPNAKGRMDAWFKPTQGTEELSTERTYTGDHLREMGFEIPQWEFVNVRDQELNRLGRQVNHDQRAAIGLANVDQFPERILPEEPSPVAEALVESMLDGDDEDEEKDKGVKRIDYAERLKKLRARRGES